MAQKAAITAYFATLTYSEENYPEDGHLKKTHLQLFFKRLRKKQDNYIKELGIMHPNGSEWPKIKYYAVGEYGTKTERAHYHAILFNVHPKIAEDMLSIWGLGHVVCVPSNGATIHYTTKYVVNKTNGDNFSLSSQNLGIEYDINASYHRKGSINHVVSDGIPMRMPRYYKDRYFGNFQKAIMAKRTEDEIKSKDQKEIERLSFLHPNPIAYISERNYTNASYIKQKINKKNKL